MTGHSPPSRRSTPAVYFREGIEKAEAAGLARAGMILRLTRADESKLKRDPSLAISDISFSEGTMRFLGVKVELGGVTVSALEHSQPETPPLKP
ncbi:MAG: hypothetical protein JO111_18360 [Caulobacteraceae bacterium]|nr:hypothetical protein [Caulobacteraceae bacterium]